MVVLRLVQWVNLAEVVTNWSDMIGNDVNHNSDAFAVSGVNEGLEIILTSEVGIDLLPVSGPISVITILQVVNDWGDPDGIETESLNIIKVVLDTLPGTSTVVAEVSASTVVSIGSSKSICKNLVNRSLFPVVDITSLSGHDCKSSRKGNF